MSDETYPNIGNVTDPSLIVLGLGATCVTCGFRYWEHKDHIITCPVCRVTALEAALAEAQRDVKQACQERDDFHTYLDDAKRERDALHASLARCVEALKEIRRLLLQRFGRNNTRALIECMEEVASIVTAALDAQEEK